MYAERHQKDPSAARFAAAGISGGIGLLTVVIAMFEMVLFALQPQVKTLSWRWSCWIVLPCAPMVCFRRCWGRCCRFGADSHHCGSASHLEHGIGRGHPDRTGRRSTGQDASCCLGRASGWVVASVVVSFCSGASAFPSPTENLGRSQTLGPTCRSSWHGLVGLQVNSWTDTLLASWPALFGATLFGFISLGGGQTQPFRWRLVCINSLGCLVSWWPSAFPRLSQTRDQPGEFQDTLRAAGYGPFRRLARIHRIVRRGHTIVRAVFEGGLSPANDAPRVVIRLLWTYGPGIWAMSCIHVLVRACYAKGDGRGPVRIGMVLNSTCC